MISLMNLLAQGAPATTQATPGAPAGPPTDPPAWMQWAPIIILVVIFYFFLFRSKRTQDRKRTDMLKQLKKGDRIQTIGGVLGSVIEARDDEVLVKVDESSNTKIRFARSAIHRVLEDAAKPEK